LKQADLQEATTRVLEYRPAEPVIRTKVFPVINPLHNSFALDLDTDLVIFLYFDPSVCRASLNARLPRRQSSSDASAGLLALWPREILEKAQAQTNDRPFQTLISH